MVAFVRALCTSNSTLLCLDLTGNGSSFSEAALEQYKAFLPALAKRLTPRPRRANTMAVAKAFRRGSVHNTPRPQPKGDDEPVSPVSAVKPQATQAASAFASAGERADRPRRAHHDELTRFEQIHMFTAMFQVGGRIVL